jgi:hypothetical protein
MSGACRRPVGFPTAAPGLPGRTPAATPARPCALRRYGTGQNAANVRDGGQLSTGIGWITASAGALLGDPQYALLNAKRVCEMVIDVVVGAELLLQADLGEGKRELAASFIHRRVMAVEMNARRVATGDASRIKRYDRILGLSRE